MTSKDIEFLVRVANILDQIGLVDEANDLEKVAQKNLYKMSKTAEIQDKEGDK
jgi:hypothetical protein